MNLPNIQIKKILYATDLSETAAHAFAYAVSLANLYGARITILHVQADFPGEDFITNMISTDTWKAIKQRHYTEARDRLISEQRDHQALEDVLNAFSKEVQAEADKPDFVTDEILIKEGKPAEVIVETAVEKNCNLIVMGTHGYGSITDVLVGSTARWVIRKSRIPVLVIRLPA